ncbi:alpha-N-acetylglucosaminidase-like protein [Leptotrombidium deliense]|uniref:Alpha-N-acetylglucosaminidase-like protein n=1 Tax=Leptotrombidium deliense TaxID=299467 RepID=A0A443RZ16_9ACAR|nr:alpha-N-acetylglucosaminidase-like protein [Leptotrombidium deliense]
MFTGQEYVWKKESNGKPAKMGGPLSDNWHNLQFNLAMRIVNRMRDFSMLTVFPAVAGQVPRNLTRV